jgi:anti-anti-sigma regulatory factor/methyl-accepting chemotaxis protein
MQRFTRRLTPTGSIRSRLLRGFGLILILSSLSGLIAYISLSRVQSTQAVLQRTNRIRHLSLELETSFLLARQQETSFLDRWRVIGFDEARAVHVTANQDNLAEAQARLVDLNALIADDPRGATAMAELQAETLALRPLLETYAVTFDKTVAAIDERSRADGLEQTLQLTADQLETTTITFTNQEFHTLILQIRGNEQSYLNTRQQAHIDTIRLLTRRFISLAESSPIDTTTGSAPVPATEVVAQIETYRRVFTQLVDLDTQVVLNTTTSRDLTNDISAHTDRIVVLTESSLSSAAARLDTINRQSIIGLILAATLAIGLGIVAALRLARQIINPLTQLSQTARMIGAGNFDQMVTITADDEFLIVGEALNAMTGQIRALVGTLEDRVHERTAELEDALVDLRSALAVRDQLHATIRHLSSPVVPILKDVLVMPLVGTIDADRSQQLIESLLAGITHHRPRIVIVDVTGVPLIDEVTAHILVDASLMVRLLGVQLLLVGLRPEHAQTIVSLGVDLTTVATRADLQSGIRYAMEHAGS